MPSSLSSSSSFFCAYIPTIPPLRWDKITIILSSVSMTLLLLRYNCTPLYQSSNFIQSPLNYPKSGTMLFSIIACIFLFAGTSAVDISMFVFSYLLEASSVICKDSSHFNNTSILFILLKLILVSFYSLYYICFVWQVTLPSFVYRFCLLHLSYKISSSMLYQILQP